jgi:hypothetical protein
MRWNIPSKAWTGGMVMADASLNRHMAVRLAEAVALVLSAFAPNLPT